MRRDRLISRSVLACGLALACAGTFSIPARGQIATVVDEHGHKIFVNAADLPSPAVKMARASRYRHLAPPPAEFSSIVEKTADRHQVDPKLVHAIIQVESAYNPRAVSRKGAQGLMQLIPSTAVRFGVQNSFNPRQNIEGGVTYLRYLLDLFGGDVPLSVAAYNAGENAVLRKGGIPRYKETVNYVEHVTSLYGSSDAFFLKKPAAAATIYRLVDANGVVHYTNGDGL
jgi:soluble lytic murein transglycosylase-like protein